MKSFRSCLISSAAVLALASCSDDNPWGVLDGEGYIHPSISADSNVRDAVAVTRAESADPNAPEAKDLRINLIAEDGSRNTWATADIFPTDKAFKVGAYTIEAVYGDPDDEGFKRPCYYGSTKFNLLQGETFEPEVVATLANTMVSVDYTESFRNYFPSYTIFLRSSEGVEDHTLLETDNEPLYLKPGNVRIIVSFARADGKTATIEAGSFIASAKHHYHVTLDVNNGSTGDAQLQVLFDDNITEENVYIDLSDELFTQPGPSAYAVNFDPETTFVALEQTLPDDGTAPRITFDCPGKIASAQLTISAPSVVFPSMNSNSFDLMALSEQQQRDLEARGLNVVGLFRNPDRMGYIDFGNLLGKLKAGEYSFSLLLKDKLGQVNEPITFKATLEPLSVTLESVAASTFGDYEGLVTVGYNGADPEKNLKVKLQNDRGIWEDAEILSIAESTRAMSITRAENRNYDIRFRLPHVTQDIPVRVYYQNESTHRAQGVIEKHNPQYSFTADAYATKVILHVNAATPELTELITRQARIFSSSEVTSSRLIRDVDAATITVTGCKANTTYSYKSTVLTGSSVEAGDFTETFTVTTEEALPVPNGSFEDTASTIALTDLNQGGTWTRTTVSSATKFQTTVTINAEEPTGWASVNAKTCNANASAKNSWFMVPSTYSTDISWVVKQPTAKVLGIGQSEYTETPATYKDLTGYDNKGVVVRNVAWDLNGSVPSNKSQTGSADYSNYFNPNEASPANVSAGKLFLGSYSYADGSENYNEGVTFSSRPSALKGWWKYAPDSQDASEKATVRIQILNGTDVIGSGQAELGSQADYAQFNVPIAYTSSGKKATSLRIMISSSNKTDESTIKVTKRATKQEQIAFGAVLTVDELEFVY